MIVDTLETARGLSKAMSDHCLEKNYSLLEGNFFANLPTIKIVPGVQKWKGARQGETVVVAGAGPSLAAALPLLRERRTPVVACDRAALLLLDAGIIPDLIVSIEIHDLSVLKFQGRFRDLRRIPMGFSPVACPETVRLWQGPLFTWDHPDIVKGKGIVRLGTGVATLALGMAELMGASQIVLAGVDLAYPENLPPHAEGIPEIPGDVIEGPMMIASASGGVVPSSVNMFCNVEEIARAAKEGVRVVQTSPCGAYIPGAAHSSLEAAL